jgi:hypothetical protein
MSPRHAIATVLLVAGMAAMPALAEDSCKEDMKLLCPGVEPGSGRIMDCLREHQSRLSAPCSARLASNAAIAKKMLAEFGRACLADADRFCAAIEPGEGRVIGCLAQHEVDLSPSCQSEMKWFDETRGRVATVRRACSADATRLCGTAPHRAEALIECLEMNEIRLSSGCNLANVRLASEAAAVVDAIDEMSSKNRIREALEILQGIDSIAFSRSQVLLQFDAYQRLAGVANAGRILFNPQFVFGHESQFAIQVKAPVSAIFPSAPGAPTQFGLADVLTAFSWNFLNLGHVRQYLSLGLQWETAASPALGTAWAIVPAYAIGLPLFRGVSLTTQVAWYRTLGSARGYSEQNILVLEPILVFNLPGRTFLALDTKLGWDFPTSTFVPVMKGVAGIFTDRQRSVSISAWYQASLSAAAVSKSFDYGVGMGISYFFDW